MTRIFGSNNKNQRTKFGGYWLVTSNPQMIIIACYTIIYKLVLALALITDYGDRLALDNVDESHHTNQSIN